MANVTLRLKENTVETTPIADVPSVQLTVLKRGEELTLTEDQAIAVLDSGYGHILEVVKSKGKTKAEAKDETQADQ